MGGTWQAKAEVGPMKGGGCYSSPHSLGYPPTHMVSFSSVGIRTRHQELKVLREASLQPTELLAQFVARMLP